MDDRTALIRSVLERPDDDIPRRVLADYLRENGEGDRADFIELQIAMAEEDKASRRKNNCRCDGGGGICGACADGRDWNAMAKRERELWAVVIDPMFHGCGLLPVTETEYRQEIEGGENTSGVIIARRGFGSTVRCDLQSWVGWPCDQCSGRGQRTTYGDGSGPWGPCQYCSATGRIRAHGPRIVAEHPVQEVRVSDAGFVFDDDSHDLQNYFTFRFLESFLTEPLTDEGENLYRANGSREFLLGELSNYLVNWSRREAGLPPLPNPG